MNTNQLGYRAKATENAKPSPMSHMSGNHGKDSKLANKHQSTGNINTRSFSVNRAFKDITQKVLNSSGAQVITNRTSGMGHQVRTTASSVGSTGRADASKGIMTQATGLNRGTENSQENMQRNKRTSPSVGSTNQQPSKQVNLMPHVSYGSFNV